MRLIFSCSARKYNLYSCISIIDMNDGSDSLVGSILFAFSRTDSPSPQAEV
jgi:hypothetical protein